MTHSQEKENGRFSEWLPAPPIACCFPGMCAKSSAEEDGLVVMVDPFYLSVRYKKEDPATGRRRRIMRKYDKVACGRRLMYSPCKTFPKGSRVKHLHRPGRRCLR